MSVGSIKKLMMANKSVPLIDMKDANFGEKMVKALEVQGCFRVVNHGVEAELMAEMKAVAHALMELPSETKLLTLDPNNPFRGYTAPSETYPLYEGLNVEDVDLPENIDTFCSQLLASPHQKEVLHKYASALDDLMQYMGMKLMEGLGIQEFEGNLLFKNWACQLKLNRYNYGPQTAVGSTGGLLHTDPGFFTILQDDEIVNGLEIVDKDTTEFLPLDPLPGSFVVNLGDVAKVWSNGRFWISQHRVQCHAPTVRASIAYFALAPRDEKVETSPQMVDSDHPCRYVPFDFEDYRMLRGKTRSGLGEALNHFLHR